MARAVKKGIRETLQSFDTMVSENDSPGSAKRMQKVSRDLSTAVQSQMQLVKTQSGASSREVDSLRKQLETSKQEVFNLKITVDAKVWCGETHNETHNTS